MKGILQKAKKKIKRKIKFIFFYHNPPFPELDFKTRSKRFAMANHAVSLADGHREEVRGGRTKVVIEVVGFKKRKMA